MNDLAGAIRRTIGINVALVREPLGDADALQSDDVRSDVPVGHGEHAHIAGGFQFFVAGPKYAVRARLGRYLGKLSASQATKSSKTGGVQIARSRSPARPFAICNINIGNPFQALHPSLLNWFSTQKSPELICLELISH